jgi:hypothetical protein
MAFNAQLPALRTPVLDGYPATRTRALPRRHQGSGI